MNSFLNLLTEKLFNLYDVYEDHAFNSYVKDENKYKLVVTFMEKNMIHFAMFEKDEKFEYQLVDEIYIGFEQERDLYEAISLKLFIKALGNVMIHKIDRDIYFNAKHKRYVVIIAKDNELRDLFNQIIINQENKIIDLNSKIVKEKDALVKSKIFDRGFLNYLDNRVQITKDMLRR